MARYQAWIAGSGAGANYTGAAAIRYSQPGAGAAPGEIAGASGSAIDLGSRVTHRGPNVTLQDLHVRQMVNTRIAASTVTMRKNGAGTTMAVSIAASTTGNFTDADTVSLTAGDTYNIEVSMGGASGNWGPGLRIGYTVDAGAGVDPYQLIGNSQSTALTTASSAHGFRFGGGGNPATSAVERDHSMPLGGTFSNLVVGIQTNGRTTASTAALFKAGAATALSVSITASTTGVFEDTTNSVTVVRGDVVGGRITTGTGAGTTTPCGLGVYFRPDEPGRFWMPNGFNPGSQTGGTAYYRPIGGHAGNTTVTDIYNTARQAGVLRSVYARATSNAATGAVTMTVHKNGSASLCAVSITAATTGVFTDLNDGVPFVAGDTLDYRFTGGTSGAYTAYTDAEVVGSVTTFYPTNVNGVDIGGAPQPYVWELETSVGSGSVNSVNASGTAGTVYFTHQASEQHLLASLVGVSYSVDVTAVANCSAISLIAYRWNHRTPPTSADAMAFAALGNTTGVKTGQLAFTTNQELTFQDGDTLLILLSGTSTDGVNPATFTIGMANSFFTVPGVFGAEQQALMPLRTSMQAFQHMLMR
jgi:hypothetical protein